jgi:hypothetical protein
LIQISRFTIRIQDDSILELEVVAVKLAIAAEKAIWTHAVIAVHSIGTLESHTSAHIAARDRFARIYFAFFAESTRIANAFLDKCEMTK